MKMQMLMLMEMHMEPTFIYATIETQSLTDLQAQINARAAEGFRVVQYQVETLLFLQRPTKTNHYVIMEKEEGVGGAGYTTNR